ncbi:VWA domain-containing protein [Mycobacterium sp. MBM]|nr:VWA domain-containing protein [Mycobacterium sp. MBM]
MALLIGLIWWLIDQRDPRSLDDTYLSGERNLGCVRVFIASDESGSMQEFIQPRAQALRQLLQWAPANLRGDDELSVLVFSGHAEVAMPPTAIADDPATSATGGPTDNTLLANLLGSIGGLPRSQCVQSLILLSDGRFQDLPTNKEAARQELRDAGIDRLYLLVPGEDIVVEQKWSELYPYAPPVVFDGADPDRTGLAFGATFGDITGQELAKR